MRVLFFANSAWNIRNFRWGLVRAFRARGDEVLVAAPSGEQAEAIRAEGIEFHPLAMHPASMNPLHDVALLGRTLALYRRLRPDASLHFTIKPVIYGGLAAARLGIPSVANISGLGTIFQRPSLAQTVVRVLYRLALAKAATVFFQNPDDRALFLEAGLVAEERAALLPGSGVDTERFAPLPPREPHEGVVFLLAARMIREKGVEEYVKAARAVRAERPEARFLLAGETEVANPSAIPRSQIEAWEAEGVVRYLGFARDVRELLREVDCVVLPSYYREGVPRSLLEAAAMAKPVITTASVGCREAVIDGASGFLCEPRDAEDLAAAMRRFLALSPEERRRMGEAGRRLIEERFDERIVIRAYFEALERAAGGWAAGREGAL